MASAQVHSRRLHSATIEGAAFESVNGSLNLPFELLQAIFLTGNRGRKTLAKLSRVCRLWRSIINQSTELWTTIRPFSRNSKDLDDAFRRIEWLVQRTQRNKDHSGSGGASSEVDGETYDTVLLNVIWDPSKLLFTLDKPVVATYFLLSAPPIRWRSLHISLGKYEDARILAKHRFDNLQDLNIRGSQSLAMSMERKLQAKLQTQSQASNGGSSSLRRLTICEYDSGLFATIVELRLIGPSTQVRFECTISGSSLELYRPFFNQVRHLHIPLCFWWRNNTIFQHVTHLHVQMVNPFHIQNFEMPSLTQLSIDLLLLYSDSPLSQKPVLRLPQVDEIRIQRISNECGRLCGFDAPVLRHLYLGRPERRILEALSVNPYSHLTLCLHIYSDRVLQLVRPYLGQISSLHLICGPLSTPLEVFPFFIEDGEAEKSYIGSIHQLRISVGRRRLIGDRTMLEEPAHRFHFRHSLESTVIDWRDGSRLEIQR